MELKGKLLILKCFGETILLTLEQGTKRFLVIVYRKKIGIKAFATLRDLQKGSLITLEGSPQTTKSGKIIIRMNLLLSPLS